MLYEEENGDIFMGFTGDWLITRKISVFHEPRFLEMIELLRGADVTFGNSETLYHRYESPPIPDSGPYGTYAACDPDVIDDLRWAGVDMVSTANNHCVDYGEGGVLRNIAYLDEHKMPHAGTGRNLTEAVAPAYLDTPHGSVALIGVTLTMPPADHRAGDPRGITLGRAGANVLRHRLVNTVPVEAFERLREVGSRLSLGRGFSEEASSINFLGSEFVLGDEYNKKSFAHPGDLARNVASVRDARAMADWVVVSMHNHERGSSLDEPADFAIEFAHACVDAGADAVFGHGPHRERGIEIYKGKPIIYALGDFVIHNELIKWEPWDLFDRYGFALDATTTDLYDFRSGNGTRGMAADPLNYQSAIVRCRFTAHGLSEIELHPVDLGFDNRRSQQGRPVLAEGRVAESVLGRLQELSAPFGTKVQIEGTVGHITIG